MEQILLRQLSSLQQEQFQLTLRCNNKKMAIYRKQLSQYLLSNSLTVDITEQQDNLLVADKIQILSETRYSNNTITKETLYTGSYCTSVFQYVLSHCKLKCSKNQPLSDLMLKFKIEPIIRFEYHLTGKKKKDKIVKRKDKKEEEGDQKGNEIVTQRNSVKSNRHLNSHRRNEEDESMNPSQHYHGRKCYCCSNRSEDSDQPESPNNLFCRSPTKPNENKENSYTRSSKVGQFGKNSKKSPQSQMHTLQIRGNSSRSDRNKNSPSLYFRKHLQTIANKKGNDDNNRNTKLLTSQKPNLGQGFANTEQNNWIKTKRNEENTANKNEMDNNRVTQIKQGNKYSDKIPRNDDKLFHRSFKQKQDNQFKDLQNFKESSNNRIINQLQTMKNSLSMTKTEIEQRYSQISPPIDYSKLQTLGGYSHDEKCNSKTYASMQKKINHQRNQSLESWIKGKKELDPIFKMMRNNQKNSEAVNKSNEKGNNGLNRINSEKDNLFFEKPSIKAEETSKAQSNRIKKIPLTQKMQMLKQNQDKQKSSHRVQAEKIENEPTQAFSIQKREIAPKKTSNSKQIFRSPSMPLKRSERVINRSTKPSIITTKVEQTKQEECKEPQSPHEDDNFSVTQEKIDKKQANNCIRLSQKQDCEEDKQSKLEKDLATTIKQISYNDQLNLKEQNIEKQENAAQVTENSRVNTSRTIPFRNDVPTPTQQQDQERKSLQIIEKEEDRQSQQRQQGEFFDNLLAQNTENEETPITNRPQTALIVHNDRSPIKMFNCCQSEQLIEIQKMPSKQAKVSANSTAFIQPQKQSILGQEEFKSDSLNQSVPSEFSSTRKLKLKENKSRISIDSKFPLGIDSQAFNKNYKSISPPHSQDNFVEKSKDSLQNNNILSENNLQQFEKQLFDAPKPNERQRQIVREDSRKAKEFLRLETIDEVNESIYRQSDKKDIEEKYINASFSSLCSSKCMKGKDDHVVSQKFVSEKSINDAKEEKIGMEKASSSKPVESKSLNEEAYQQINEAEFKKNEIKGKNYNKTSQIEEQSPQVVENKENLSRIMSDCASEEAQLQEPIQQNHQQPASLNYNEVNLKEESADSEKESEKKQDHEKKKDSRLVLINNQPLKKQSAQFKGDVIAAEKQRQQNIEKKGKQNNNVAFSSSETQINEDNEEIQVYNKQNKEKVSSQMINQSVKVGNSKSQNPVQEEQNYTRTRNTLKEPKKTQINKILTEQTEVNEQLRQSQNSQKKSMKSIEVEEVKPQAGNQAKKVENVPCNQIEEKVQHDNINIPLGSEQSQEKNKVKQEKKVIQVKQVYKAKQEKQKEQENQQKKGKQAKLEDKVGSTAQIFSSNKTDSLPIEQKNILNQKQKGDKANSQHQNEEKPIIVTSMLASNEQMPHQQQSSHQPIKSDRLLMKSAEINPPRGKTFESKQDNLDKPANKVCQQRKEIKDNPHRVKSSSDNQQVKQEKKSQQVNQSKKQVFEQKDNVLHEVKQTQTNINSAERKQSSQIVRNNIEVQTDYILPNEQPENEELSVYKSQSDHLSIKKCKISLCQPQIVNSYQKFGSAAEITSQKHLKKKNRMQTKVEREHYRPNEKSSETNILNMENQNDLESEGKRQTFQPLSEKYEPQAQEKPDKIEKSRDMESSNRQQLSNSNKEEERQMNQTANDPYNLKLQFKEDVNDSQENHPSIINKLIYKNFKILSFQKIIHLKAETQRKLQIIGNCIFFVDKYLPSFLNSLTNNKKTEICLFINNQWTLFKDKSKELTLEGLLLSQLEEQSIFKCLEMLTGMPMRILKDKQHQVSKKRLIKSVKTLLQKRDEQKSFETVLYGLNKFNQEIISLQKVRYFLDNSKISRSILQCKKIHSKKNEQLCNFQGDIINEFIQVFLIKHPRYLTLEVDNTTMNTYQIELTNSIFYVSGNYKFILYEETAKNQYKLTKESFLWLKHKNQQQLTKYLLILEPIPDKKGQTIITMRLATGRQFQEGSHTNRVVKYQNGGKAKGYQGGYENQKNLYLPVVKEIIKNDKKGN